jgi:hypothetical protein
MALQLYREDPSALGQLIESSPNMLIRPKPPCTTIGGESLLGPGSEHDHVLLRLDIGAYSDGQLGQALNLCSRSQLPSASA